MGQVLRVTIGTSDYSFKLLEVKDAQISVEVNGKSHLLTREGPVWVSVGEAPIDPQLAEAIGKAVALRYRI